MTVGVIVGGLLEWICEGLGPCAWYSVGVGCGHLAIPKILGGYGEEHSGLLGGWSGELGVTFAFRSFRVMWCFSQTHSWHHRYSTNKHATHWVSPGEAPATPLNGWVN